MAKFLNFAPTPGLKFIFLSDSIANKLLLILGSVTNLNQDRIKELEFKAIYKYLPIIFSANEMKDGFSLFDKVGDNNIEASQIGDVMRAFGINPTNVSLHDFNSCFSIYSIQIYLEAN